MTDNKVIFILYSDVCKFTPGVQGPCRESIPSWTRNQTNEKCQQFTYSGCGGNENRFASEAECQVHCHSEIIGSKDF